MKEFIKLGKNPNDDYENSGFNMAILALKLAKTGSLWRNLTFCG